MTSTVSGLARTTVAEQPPVLSRSADLPDGQISDCALDAAASEEGPVEWLNDCARELFRIFRILLDGRAE
jgi:hypothetical protein